MATPKAAARRTLQTQLWDAKLVEVETAIKNAIAAGVPQADLETLVRSVLSRFFDKAADVRDNPFVTSQGHISHTPKEFAEKIIAEKGLTIDEHDAVPQHDAPANTEAKKRENTSGVGRRTRASTRHMIDNIEKGVDVVKLDIAAGTTRTVKTKAKKAAITKAPQPAPEPQTSTNKADGAALSASTVTGTPNTTGVPDGDELQTAVKGPTGAGEASTGASPVDAAKDDAAPATPVRRKRGRPLGANNKYPRKKPSTVSRPTGVRKSAPKAASKANPKPASAKKATALAKAAVIGDGDGTSPTTTTTTAPADQAAIPILGGHSDGKIDEFGENTMSTLSSPLMGAQTKVVASKGTRASKRSRKGAANADNVIEDQAGGEGATFDGAAEDAYKELTDDKVMELQLAARLALQHMDSMENSVEPGAEAINNVPMEAEEGGYQGINPQSTPKPASTTPKKARAGGKYNNPFLSARDDEDLTETGEGDTQGKSAFSFESYYSRFG